MKTKSKSQPPNLIYGPEPDRGDPKLLPIHVIQNAINGRLAKGYTAHSISVIPEQDSAYTVRVTYSLNVFDTINDEFAIHLPLKEVQEITQALKLHHT